VKVLAGKQRLLNLIRRLKWSLFRHLGRRSILFQADPGYRLRLEFSDLSALEIYLRRYEPEETRLILDLVKPHMVTMDIGANIGYFTLLMAHLVGSQGRVHAFEPNPVMLRKLEENIALNTAFRDDRVAIHRVALGATEGEAEFFCPRLGHEGLAGLRRTNRAPIANVIRVPVQTIDGFIRAHGIERVDFIKMDIEGGELDVLRGSHRLLAELRPAILFEAFESNTAAYGYRVFEILSYLEQRGYLVKQAGMSFNFLAMPRAAA